MPKGLKSCLFTKSIRNLIAKYETANATAIPTRRMATSVRVGMKPLSINFKILSPEAPSIIGMAIKNENSALASLETPEIRPPIIVDPDRDVPGTSERS